MRSTDALVFSRVFLASKEFTSIATEKEKWFGTQYKQEHLPDELIKKCEECELIAELHLPKPNEFIPTDFHLFSKDAHTTRPQLPTKIKVRQRATPRIDAAIVVGERIRSAVLRRRYVLQAAQGVSLLRIAKVSLAAPARFDDHVGSLDFSPLGNADPIHANMNALYSELVEDSLTEIVYPAQLGGLQYELSSLNYGIQVGSGSLPSRASPSLTFVVQFTLHGFNHKIKQLLETIIDRMVNITVHPQRFEILREKVP